MEEMLLLGGSRSCSETDCPISFCSCFCHTHQGVMHCMPCCYPAACSKCGKVMDRVSGDMGKYKKVES